MRSLAISAAAGGGAGVVMAGEGDRLGGGEGADGEDDGDEGSGVLRLMVSRLGSAGMGVAGFGSSFTSGFTSASGSLEVEAIGDRAGEEASRCLTSSKPGGRPDGPSLGDSEGVTFLLGTRLGMRLGGCVPGRLREATTAGRGGLATGAGGGWLSRASISWDWLGWVLR